MSFYGVSPASTSVDTSQYYGGSTHSGSATPPAKSQAGDAIAQAGKARYDDFNRQRKEDQERRRNASEQEKKAAGKRWNQLEDRKQRLKMKLHFAKASHPDYLKELGDQLTDVETQMIQASADFDRALGTMLSIDVKSF